MLLKENHNITVTEAALNQYCKVRFISENKKSPFLMFREFFERIVRLDIYLEDFEKKH